jgi:hypothetical protein
VYQNNKTVDNLFLYCISFISGLAIYLSGTIPSNAFLFISLVIWCVLSLFGKKYFVTLKGVFFVFLLILTIGYLNYVLQVRDAGANTLLALSVKYRFLWLIIYIPLFILVIHRRTQFIKKLIFSLLIFNVFIWYLQFFVSYLTGDFFDILNMFGLREQRGEAYIFKKLSLGIQLWRPTGLFHEPGTYASVVIQLLIFDYIGRGKVLTKTHILTLLSFLLCLSSFSILLAGFFVCVHLYLHNSKTSSQKLGKLAFFILILVFGIGYSVMRFTGNYRGSGLEFREVIFLKWALQGFELHLLGNRIDDTIIAAGKTNSYDAFVEDLSLLFYMFYHFGFVFTLAILALVRKLAKNSANFLIIFCIFLSKVNLSSYFLWFTFICLYNEIQKQYSKEKMINGKYHE